MQEPPRDPGTGRTEAGWSAALAARLDRRVEVHFGRARTTPVQIVDDRRVVRVRLHRLFAAAPEPVLDDLAAWMRAGRRARSACRRLDAWIDARLAELPPARPRAMALRADGHAHDLHALAAPLYDAEFLLDFEQRPRPALTWGRRARSRARRSLHLGSYELQRHVVRIHPVLDQLPVPPWFVRYVLFHEILHAALPRAGHPPEFRERERAYADYARAVRWQHRNIAALIHSARTGRPLR